MEFTQACQESRTTSQHLPSQHEQSQANVGKKRPRHNIATSFAFTEPSELYLHHAFESKHAVIALILYFVLSAGMLFGLN